MSEAQRYITDDYLHLREPAALPNLYAGPRLYLDEESLSWQDDANCKGSDPEVFFIEKGGSTKQARAICQECVVIEECRDYAIDTGQRFGVWANLSEEERKEERKARKSRNNGSQNTQKLA